MVKLFLGIKSIIFKEFKIDDGERSNDFWVIPQVFYEVCIGLLLHTSQFISLYGLNVEIIIRILVVKVWGKDWFGWLVKTKPGVRQHQGILDIALFLGHAQVK